MSTQMPGENRISIASWPEQPLSVNSETHQTMSFRGDIPVCIKICEPICARSEYSIGITIFDRPVATITVGGETRFFACGNQR
jgi:hypothetical protein